MLIDTHTHFLPSKSSTPDWKNISLYFDMAVNNDIDVLCYTEHLDAINYSSLLQEIFISNKLQGDIMGDGIIKLKNGLIVSSGAEISIAGGADVGVHANASTLLQLNTNKGFYTLESLVQSLQSLSNADTSVPAKV